jgi:dihydrodiol dehydrogenase / D-xylose 1-dehydrogenase (NADP)
MVDHCNILGTVLDLGVYTIQMSLWVFRSEPTKIISFGKLNEDGLDMEVTAEYHFKNGGLAKIQTSCLKPLSNKCIITGTKGKFILPDFWCPLEVIDVDGTKITWTLPKGAYEFNLQNSSGLRFEAEEARRCITAGLIESPSIPHSESLLIARIEDTIRKQIGVNFDEDKIEY